jgi:hypothetical protein
MPNIPIAQSRRSFSEIPESGVQASPDAFGYQEARVNYEGAMRKMSMLGDLQAQKTKLITTVVGGAAEIVKGAMMADAKLDAQTKLGEFELGLKQDYAEAQANGDGNYLKTSLEEFDKRADKLKESAGMFQGDYYDQGLAKLRLSWQEEGINREIAARKQTRIDNTNKLADIAEVKVYQNPSTVDSVIGETVVKIEETGLTPEQKTKAIEGVNSRFRKVAIEAHLANGDVAGARKLLDDPMTVQSLGGIEALRVRREVDKAQEELVERQDAAAVAEGLSRGTLVLDPEDTKARARVDKAWKVAGGNGQIAQMSPQAAQTLKGWVDHYGVVPSSSLSVLNAMAKNGSEEQRAYAYQVVNQVESSRPGVTENSGAKTGLQKDAERFRYYTEDLGLGQADALKRIEDQRKPEWKAKEDERRTDARKLTSKMKPTELSDAYDTSVWSTPAVGGDPRRNDVILSTYKRAYEEHYIETGDEDQARTLAMKDLRRTYNTSSVTGQERIMKHPPELYYAPINGGHDWIGKQLQADVKGITGKDIPLDRIYIEANRATDEAITAAPRGQAPRPVYAVVFKDEAGNYQTIPGKLFKPDEIGARSQATDAAMKERQGLVDEQEQNKANVRAVEQRAREQQEIANVEEAATARGVQMTAAEISMKLETGGTDPMRGVSQIVVDTGGTKSYGNFGLNSGGSVQQFLREYGHGLGITGTPGTPEFDRSWTTVAQTKGQALHNAELEWYSKHVIARVSNRLEKAGVPDEMANDPRVAAYFADRSIQQGVGSIDLSKKHRERIQRAVDVSKGDPVKFLEIMTAYDQASVGQDFPRALRQGNYSAKANRNRTGNRKRMSLLAGDPDSRDKVQNLVELFGLTASMSNALR